LRYDDAQGSAQLIHGNPRLQRGTEVYVDSIVPALAMAKAATAQVRVAPTQRKGPPNLSAQVTIGDVLIIGEFGHEVRNIVPADEKNKLIGWVEFALSGVPLGQLKNSKVRVVEPSPLQ
jgi:hypothetical protein